MNLSRAALAVCATLVLVACARPDAAWEEARRLDTPDGYASYQERHPRSPHAAEARTADTVDSYRDYLAKHPEGLWAGKAKERVAALTVAPSVVSVPTLTPPPPTPPTPTPMLVPPSTPKVFVQLGAFSSAEGAQKAWRELQSRHAALRDLQAVYQRSGKDASGLHLLKAGVATPTDAEKLCRALQAAGQACLIS
jgi:SPOR domain